MRITPELLNYAPYALIALLAFFAVWAVWTEMRFRRFLKGGDGKSLENIIVGNKKDIETIQKFRAELEEYLKNVEKRLRHGGRGISAVRFNPFSGDGSGGKQSFAVALINQEGDGIILSSLYSREKTSVFAKPVIKNKSEHELTNEEKQVLRQANESLEELAREGL